MYSLSTVSRWTKSRSSNYLALRRRSTFSPTSTFSSARSSPTALHGARQIKVLFPRRPSSTKLLSSGIRWMSHVTTEPTTGLPNEHSDPNHQSSSSCFNHNNNHNTDAQVVTESTFDARQKWLQQQEEQWNQYRSQPPLPHADDDAVTLLELSQEWFQVLQQGILQKRNVGPELDHLGQVVSAYATKVIATRSSNNNINRDSNPSLPTNLSEPFALWLQSACHAQDTTRAFHVLQQWQEFEQQLQQQPASGGGDQNSNTTNNRSQLSSANLLRQFASLPSSSSKHSAVTTTASLHEYTPLDAATITWNLYLAIQRQQAHALALDPRWNMSTEAYYHLVSSLSHALKRQHRQTPNPFEPALYVNYHRQVSTNAPPPPPPAPPSPNILWDRLMQTMSEFTQHQSSSDPSYITTPAQMTHLVQAFDQALHVAEIRQDHAMILEWSEQLQGRLFQQQQQEPEQVVQAVEHSQVPGQSIMQGEVQPTFSDAVPCDTTTSTLNSLDSAFVEASSTTSTTTAAAPPPRPTPRDLRPPTIQTQVHPMLLQALQLESVQQQQQQQLHLQQQQQAARLGSNHNKRGGKNKHGRQHPLSLTSSSTSSFKSWAQQQQPNHLVSILGRVGATMQRTILSDKSLLPAFERAQLASLVVQQLESIHDQVALLPPISSTTLPSDAATITPSNISSTTFVGSSPTTQQVTLEASAVTAFDAGPSVHETGAIPTPSPTTPLGTTSLDQQRNIGSAPTTTPTTKETQPLSLPLPTLENYLLAWNGWIPLVFRYGMKGPVRMDELVYLDDLYQRIMTRRIIDEKDLESNMQIFTPLIRAHCGLQNTRRAEQMLGRISHKLKDLDVIYQPEVAKHRQIIKDLWNRLLHAEFSQGHYQDVVRLSSVMQSFNVYLTEIARTFQLQSLAELSPHQESAAVQAVHQLEVMLRAFHDYEDRGVGSYAPPPNAQHYLAVLTALLRTPENHGRRLVKAGNVALQVLDTAEAEAAQHVQKRLQYPDKRHKYPVDQLLTTPAHYETVMAIWERCRSAHRPSDKVIELLEQRMAKHKSGALKTSPKLKGLQDRSSVTEQSSFGEHHQPLVRQGGVPDVDVLLQRTRQWSGGQNILQLNTLLEDWLAVVMAEEPSAPRVGNKTPVPPENASSRKRTTSQSQAVECMQLLLTEWVEVLGQATKSNLWDSSYPSDHTNKPFRLLLQAYRHLGDGPAAFEVLNEWQRALASHWSLSPDLNSLHLVLEAYIRQQHKSPSSSKTDAVAQEVAKIWELLQRWHVSGRVNLQIETVSHVVKCLSFPNIKHVKTKPISTVGDVDSTGELSPAHQALLDRLTTCFEVMTNMLRSEVLRPVDLYFLVRAYRDGLRCAESIGDTETVLKWGHVFHNTMICQPKELIEATFQFEFENVPRASFQVLLSSAYGAVQRGIFSTPNIEPKEKYVFLENIVEELETMGKSVGGLSSSKDYLRNIQALEVCAAATDPRPSQEELNEFGEQAEQLLHRMKLLDSANERHPFLAFGGVSRIWCLAGNPQRGESILADALVEQNPKTLNDHTWSQVLDAWNGLFQSYCESGQAPEALRLWQLMTNEQFYLQQNSWYSLIQALSETDHGLSFEDLCAIWIQLEREFNVFRANGKGVPPTAEVFEHGMLAFAKGSYPFGGEFAEGILARMQTDRRASPKPSEEHYAAAIVAWLKSNNPSREDRARFLISKMSKLDVEPSMRAYKRAMEILSEGRHQIAARQAESMLDDLEKLSLLNHHLTPNRDCYAAAINAWLNTDGPAAANHAQTILDRLESEYERTNHDVALQPSADIYERMIHKWAHSSIKDGGLRAEQNLSRWETLVEEQGLNRPVTPYLKAIQANRLDKGVEAGELAESVLERLQQHFGERNPQAVATAATEVMLAWAHCTHPDMGIRNWNLYKRLSKTNKASNLNTLSIKNRLEAVIRACAYSTCEDKGKREETLKAALKAFEELQERNIEVSSTVYKNMLQTFGRHVRDSGERTKVVTTIFQRCCAEGKVDQAVVTNVKLHSIYAYYALCTGPDQRVVIQPEWCRNVPALNEIHKHYSSVGNDSQD